MAGKKKIVAGASKRLGARLLACLAVCRFETEFPGKRNPDRRSRLHLGSFNPLDSWIFPHPSATRIFATPPCHATTRKENISKPSEESGSRFQVVGKPDPSQIRPTLAPRVGKFKWQLFCRLKSLFYPFGIGNRELKKRDVGERPGCKTYLFEV